jgi:membrane protease YdiL (CAAX protease family)
MDSKDLSPTSTIWDWRVSLDVAILTIFLNASLSLLLSALLQSVSNLTYVPLIGSATGTTILGAAEVLLLIPVFAYSKKLNIVRPQLGIYVRNWQHGLIDVAFGAAVGFSMIPVSMLASAMNQLLLGPQPNAEYVRKAFHVASPLEAIMLISAIIFVVAPSEEIISRGFVQQGFERSFGKLKGLILASIAFSIMHLDLWSILPLLLLGMILGLVFRLRHGSILAPITSHAIYMVCLVVLASF